MNNNNAIYAIPGLMPPFAGKWETAITAPENGSLLMVVHAGCPYDVVNYAISIPGYGHGVIRDPGYDYAWKKDEADDAMPQLVYIVSRVPEGAIIPSRLVHGVPIPITEVELPEGMEAMYWIMELPAGTLPVGVSVVELVINDRLVKYHVNRPEFAIRHCPDRTYKVKCLLDESNSPTQEDMNLSFRAGTENRVWLEFADAGGCVVDMSLATFEAKAVMSSQPGEIILQADVRQDGAFIVFPSTIPSGTGTWWCKYTMSDIESVAAKGRLVISAP